MRTKSNSFWQRTALGLVCVLIACYTFYHMLGLFDSEMETYGAGITAETKVLSYSGYIFRDETVLTSSNSGVVDYAVRDGVKVSQGQKLAEVYEKGSSAMRDAIRRLDDQIAVLEEGVEQSAAIPEMAALQADASEQYLALIKRLAEGDPIGMRSEADDFLITLTRMDVLVYGDQSTGYNTLQALKETRRSILDEGGSSLSYTASGSGYFYSDLDGGEHLFTMAAASEEQLTYEGLTQMWADMGEGSASVEGAYGKLCVGSEWRLVMPVSLEDAAYFEVGMTYTGAFEDNGGVAIPLTLEYTKEASEAGLMMLVFSADRMPTGFSFDRCQRVSMEVTRVSGIYVPRHVVVRQDGRRGVYILRGSVVRFRYVEIVYEGSDYYLVRAGMETDEEGRAYLQVNDVIILNGKNLFDGRVMD